MTEKLKDFEMSEYVMFRRVVKVIKKKFRKYYSSMPLVFTCSAALNPCLNVGGVQSLIKSIMENLGLHLKDPLHIGKEQKRFEENFDSLFALYCDKYSQQSNPIVDTMRAGSSGQGSSSHRNQNLSINLYNTLLEDAVKRQRTSAPTSELGQYKATNFFVTLGIEGFQNFDILSWWSEREVQFPILAAMARDLLSVQASTVASESAFSVSGRIISERRSRLTAPAVEVCVCLKDYLDGVDRIQNVTSLEGPLLQDVEEGIEEEEVEMGISPTLTEVDEGEFEALEQSEEEEEEEDEEVVGETEF